jgi:hypothetical protein
MDSAQIYSNQTKNTFSQDHGGYTSFSGLVNNIRKNSISGALAPQAITSKVAPRDVVQTSSQLLGDIKDE